MKHHFGDDLDRSKGHWTITPNRNRWANHYYDLAAASVCESIITIQKDDENWSRIHELPNLTELTLDEPSKDQLSSIEGLVKLTSLRITHARPVNLDFLCGLQNLRELVLEYVSGFEDLGPISELPKLESLHLENLRRVKSFSGLRASKNLRYLSIDGTMDWSQPIQDLVFLESIKSLEYLRLAKVRVLAKSPVLSSLVDLQDMKYLKIAMNSLPLEDFAFIQALRPDIEGAVRPAFRVSEAERRLVYQGDNRHRMPESEFLSLQTAHLADDGTRYMDEPMTAFLLGKGTRMVTGTPKNILTKCELHELNYQELVRRYKEFT